MVLMTDRQTVAANSTVANVLQGKVHEFVSKPSVVRVYGQAAAVGLFMSVLVGNESVMQDQEIGAQNRMPIVPDDFVTEAGALPGDRIVVSLRNSTGAGVAGFTRVEVEEVN